MLDFFRHIDLALFNFINQRISNSFFDTVLPWCRDKNNWIPLYVVLVIWIIYLFRKQSWKILITVPLLILVTDQISSGIIKPLFHRLRPCHNPELAEHIHKLVDCGAGFSFVSSHAANHFGLAVFLIILLGRKFRWLPPLLLLWAFTISIAQVYVGVHYPSDVTGGAIIGIAFGWLAGRIVHKWICNKPSTVTVNE